MTCWFHHCLSSGISCLKNSSVIPSLYLCSTHAVTSYLRHCHWRRLYRAQCTCPPPLLQMAGYGGIVCRRTTNKKLTTLTDITKKLTKTINCTKSGGAWQKKISDASGRTCATTFKLVSASFDTVIALFSHFLAATCCSVAGAVQWNKALSRRRWCGSVTHWRWGWGACL